MNKKLIIIISIGIIFSSYPAYAQTITFEKSFPYLSPPGSIMQTNDSGFIFSAELNESVPFSYTTIKKLVLLKLDKFGYIKWQKEYGTNTGFGSPNIIRITNSAVKGFLIVTGEKYEDEWSSLVVKTDELGNELWKQTYGVPGTQEIGFGAVETENGEIIVLERWLTDAVLRKIGSPK